MTHAEPRGPVGAFEWTRRLRVGEAQIVAGGFTAAGPVAVPQNVAKAPRREERRFFGSRADQIGPTTQMLLMLHRPF